MENILSYKLIADPEIIRIPIQESNEQLIDLRHQDIIKFGPSPEIENNTDYTKLRITVYNKLIEAQSSLPKDLKFCLYEGYRSLSLQKQLFDQHYKQVKNNHPALQHEQIFTETTKLVSPVINIDGTKNIPPHSTGGAIDVYLINKHNEAVDMGILTKDWITDIDGKLSLTNSTYISEEAKYHREIMSLALVKVGFINYPTEYWHWSYGDKYWAYYTNNSFAIYGTIGE
jgi:D-alanyl-D-alanine dipeptidase